MNDRSLLGPVISSIVLLFALADIVTRLLPVEYLAFRAWEAVSHPEGAIVRGPFAANKHFVGRSAYGDLAGLGNYRDLRRFRSEQFSTDENGFRRGTTAPRYAGIVNGDSFVVGSGVNDDQTLSSRLTQRTGLGFANLGGGKSARIGDVFEAADRLGIDQGWVIYCYLERIGLPVSSDLDSYLYDGSANEQPKESWSWQRTMRMPPARLPMLLGRLKNRFSGPIDPSESVISRRRLRDGTEMLFLSLDVAQAHAEPRINDSGMVWLQEALRQRGLNLLVLLVPNKFTVYAPLLDGDVPQYTGAYLDAAARSLVAHGIRTVNLTRVLQERARIAFEAGEFIYFVDDTHWNAQGIEIVANEVLKHWQPY